MKKLDKFFPEKCFQNPSTRQRWNTFWALYRTLRTHGGEQVFYAFCLGTPTESWWCTAEYGDCNGPGDHVPDGVMHYPPVIQKSLLNKYRRRHNLKHLKQNV